MYLVCKFKDNNEMFITTRKARQMMINTLLEMGQPIESRVEKEFDTYDEAMKYLKAIELVDKKIKDL